MYTWLLNNENYFYRLFFYLYIFWANLISLVKNDINIYNADKILFHCFFYENKCSSSNFRCFQNNSVNEIVSVNWHHHEFRFLPSSKVSVFQNFQSTKALSKLFRITALILLSSQHMKMHIMIYSSLAVFSASKHTSMKSSIFWERDFYHRSGNFWFLVRAQTERISMPRVSETRVAFSWRSNLQRSAYSSIQQQHMDFQSMLNALTNEREK